MVRAVVTDHTTEEFLKIKNNKQVLAVQPWEAVIEVKAFSLNRGDITGALEKPNGYFPGWDFSGIVIEPAKTGEGPSKGSRVVGLLPAGSWAERIAVPSSFLSVIPDSLNYSEAATLPVAGLTALYALRRGGNLLGKRVLITGSTGGVGLITHQLAALGGAYTIGVVRNESKIRQVRQAGANHVMMANMDSKEWDKLEPFDLVIDSVGGENLSNLLLKLKPEGSIISIGYSDSEVVTINFRNMLHTGGQMLYRFYLGTEIHKHNVPVDLQYLAQLVIDGKLNTNIEVNTSWKNIAEVSQGLLNRTFSGKAVLVID